MNSRIKISLEVKRPESFIKDIVSQKINLYSITKQERKLEIIIEEEDYEKIRKKRGIKSLKIIEVYGKRKLKNRIKRYGILILFIGIGILLNIFLSRIIWEVEVETPNQKLRKTVLEDLKKKKIAKFHWKISYQEKEKIKEYLLQKEKEKIEWLEIEEIGTKYLVKVEEKKKQEEKKECNPRSIIAKKNAVITKIEASSGEIVKRAQEYVTKGEVLISGLIYNKETIVSKKCAIGKVYGETWYKVTVEVPKNRKKEKKTNKKSLAFHIKLAKKEWIFPSPYENSKKKEYNIIEDQKLPAKVGFLILEEVEKQEQNYTLQNVDEKAYEESEKELEKKQKRKPMIIRKKVLKKTIKDSKIIVDVFYAIEEEIGTYQDLTNVDIEKLNEEKEE